MPDQAGISLFATVNSTSNRLRWSRLFYPFHPERLQPSRKGPALPPPGYGQTRKCLISRDFSYASPPPLLPSTWLLLPRGATSVRHRQRRNPRHNASKEPRQVALCQQQPGIPGVPDQSSTRPRQPLLQACQRPITDPVFRQEIRPARRITPPHVHNDVECRPVGNLDDRAVPHVSTLQSLRMCILPGTPPWYLIRDRDRDRDRVHGSAARRQLESLGVEEVLTGLDDVEVQNFAPPVRQHDEDNQHLQRDRRPGGSSRPRPSARNVFQVWEGVRQAVRRMRETVRSETPMGSIFSSPWIRGARHNGLAFQRPPYWDNRAPNLRSRSRRHRTTLSG